MTITRRRLLLLATCAWVAPILGRAASATTPTAATPPTGNPPPAQPRPTRMRYAYFAPYASPDDADGEPTLWIQV